AVALVALVGADHYVQEAVSVYISQRWRSPNGIRQVCHKNTPGIAFIEPAIGRVAGDVAAVVVPGIDTHVETTGHNFQVAVIIHVAQYGAGNDGVGATGREHCPVRGESRPAGFYVAPAAEHNHATLGANLAVEGTHADDNFHMSIAVKVGHGLRGVNFLRVRPHVGDVVVNFPVPQHLPIRLNHDHLAVIRAHYDVQVAILVHICQRGGTHLTV